MTVNSEKDLFQLRKIGKIVALAREEMLKHIKPGILTIELDEIAKEILSENGARSAPIHEYNFPGTTCISINEVAAHGIPGTLEIKEGDIVNVDVSAELNGYFADTGATVVVEPADNNKKNLCDCSRIALYNALEKVKAGTKINQIGRAIQNEARQNGFKVIKNLTGHGIGKKLHEEPHNILNFYDKSDRSLLTNGLVLAIETFISTGAEYVLKEADGWTLKTPDKSLVAQFEHTIVVTKEKPLILTAL